VDDEPKATQARGRRTLARVTALRTVLLALSATDAGTIALGSHRVRQLEISLAPWTGARADSLADDCRKRGGLVVGSDGPMSCTEVEVVRGLRAAGWDAGWVQGFPCGRTRWSDWIWRDLPPLVDDANRWVQGALGSRPSSRSGHPDVAAIVGSRVVYVECKVADEPTESQARWLAAAVDLGVVTVRDFVVVRARLEQVRG